jgi:hypothetical protein
MLQISEESSELEALRAAKELYEASNSKLGT